MVNKNKALWYAAGLHFECARCGACCSGPTEGYIWVTKPEIKLIADYLKTPIPGLRKKYLKRVGLRTTIIEHHRTKDCIFLNHGQHKGPKGCMIYPVRPNQCRTWPFWASNLTSQNAWNKAAQKCLGINRGKLHNTEKIQKIKKSKKWWRDDKQRPANKKSS